jgi:hypothetical protein
MVVARSRAAFAAVRSLAPQIEKPIRGEVVSELEHLRVIAPELLTHAAGQTSAFLLLGFGIERTKNDLPRRSYWRVDSLTQTPLDSEDPNYVVLIAGTGDGGTIDVLRAKFKEFDHAAFCMSACCVWWHLRRNQISGKG